MKNISIAIDGYSSCGKSTLAKQIAEELHLIYIDTGAMYRAVTLFALNNNLVSKHSINTQLLLEKLHLINIRFKKETSGEIHTYLNEKNVEKEIRTMEVSECVSQVSAVKEVREKMVELQQQMGKKGGVIMDGRDIGTVVMPDAELKIFMTASDEIRAKRRWEELKQKGVNEPYERVLENLKQRDFLDSTRKESPLLQAKDARVLDNTNLTRTQQLQLVLTWVKELV